MRLKEICDSEIYKLIVLFGKLKKNCMYFHIATIRNVNGDLALCQQQLKIFLLLHFLLFIDQSRTNTKI